MQLSKAIEKTILNEGSELMQIKHLVKQDTNVRRTQHSLHKIGLKIKFYMNKLNQWTITSTFGAKSRLGKDKQTSKV